MKEIYNNHFSCSWLTEKIVVTFNLLERIQIVIQDKRALQIFIIERV